MIKKGQLIRTDLDGDLIEAEVVCVDTKTYTSPMLIVQVKTGRHEGQRVSRSLPEVYTT